MNDRFRLSSTLAKKLERQGLSPGVVLRQARLPVRLFDESKAWVTTEELFALYNAIHENSEETIGWTEAQLEDVALELRVSTRTLQRRLLEERITFQKLIEEARQGP